jgi:hypothetical protein
VVVGFAFGGGQLEWLAAGSPAPVTLISGVRRHWGLRNVIEKRNCDSGRRRVSNVFRTKPEDEKQRCFARW